MTKNIYMYLMLFLLVSLSIQSGITLNFQTSACNNILQDNLFIVTTSLDMIGLCHALDSLHYTVYLTWGKCYQYMPVFCDKQYCLYPDMKVTGETLNRYTTGCGDEEDKNMFAFNSHETWRLSWNSIH